MSTGKEFAVRNILLPTNFSSESAQAIEYVRSLQSCYDANVYVVHVLDLFPFYLASDAAAAGRMKEIQQAGQVQMQRFMETNGLNQPRFSSALLSGEISTAVETFIRECKIDLVILGSRAEEGLGRLFQGSIAEEIFRCTQCPVIVVGPKAGSIASEGAFKRLFYPTDLSAGSRAAAPSLEYFLKCNPRARISLAHFLNYNGGTPYNRYRLRRDLELELTGMIPHALHKQLADVIVDFSSPVDGIIDFAEGLAADLLVLGVRHGGSFTRAATHDLCSVAYQIISRAPCPVLTVRG
jgi:nucleotide-binding universal stress UspA family protein